MVLATRHLGFLNNPDGFLKEDWLKQLSGKQPVVSFGSLVVQNATKIALPNVQN